MKRSLRASWGWADTLFWAVLILEAAAALSLRYFPYCDATNHLARTALIERFWSGTAPPYVDVSFFPTQNILLDFVGAGIARYLSITVAERALMLFSLVAPPLGLYVFLATCAPERRGWAMVGLLLNLNWFFMTGFFPYEVGLGMLFVWLAIYWQAMRKLSRGLAVAAAVLGAVLVLFHRSAALCALAIMVSDATLAALRARRATSAEKRRTEVRRALGAVAVAVPLVGCLVAIRLGEPQMSSVASGPVEFRSVLGKILHMAAPFYWSTSIPAAVLIAFYVMCLGAFLVIHRRQLQCDAIALGALWCLGAYLCTPTGALGTYYLDDRFLLPAFLLVFCIGADSAEELPRGDHGVLIALAVFCLVNLGIVYHTARQIDGKLVDCQTALRQIPPGQNVLPLVSDHLLYGRLLPYQHFALWYMIDGHGRVPRLLNWPEATFYWHFRLNAPLLYAPDLDWGTKIFTPLDWRQIDRDYGYIVQMGDNRRASALIETRAARMAQVGETTVYKVTRPQ